MTAYHLAAGWLLFVVIVMCLPSTSTAFGRWHLRRLRNRQARRARRGALTP